MNVPHGTYDLSNPQERLALMREQPNKKRCRVIAHIIEKHYGKEALNQLREDWKAVK